MEILTIKTSWSQNEMKQNTYVVIGESSCIVIDAGAPLTAVRELTDKPIEAVFITHGHFDHVEYIEEYDKLNVPIFVNPLTPIFLKDKIKNASGFFQMDSTYNVNNLRPIQDNEEVFTMGKIMKCLYTEGHSADSVCFLLDNKYLFSGDTLFSIAVGRTDLPTGNVEDLINSLKILARLEYETMYAGHGRISTKEEQNTNIPNWIKLLSERRGVSQIKENKPSPN